MKKRILSLLLAIVMVAGMLPIPGHVHAVEGETPVCDCGTDDPAIHATTCPMYVAPENPQCFCVEKCAEPNPWCDICGFDVTACEGGSDVAVTYQEADGCQADIPITIIGDATAQAQGGVYAEVYAYFNWGGYIPIVDQITQSNRVDMVDNVIHIKYAGSYPPLCSFTLTPIQLEGYSVTMTGAVEGTYYDQKCPTRVTVTYTNAQTSALTGISVTTLPAKTSYVAGESFDPAGMVITAAYQNGTTCAVTGYTVTNGSSLTAGQTSVTVSYTENGITKTVNVPIQVTEKYTVTISSAIQNGTVQADKTKAAKGETVTLTVTPNQGYLVGTVAYNGTAITPVAGVYSFLMPAGDVTVSATFTACPHESYEDGTCTRCGAVCGHSSYENGFCTVCGAYQSAVVNADGYYEIGNLGQLMWFAQNVNTARKALLTADITIDNSVVWTPIELQDGIDYSSIFNGGGHTITFANTNEGSTFGLFSKYNYSIIENLYLTGSISCNTTDNVGALVNSAYRTTIRNVISTCSVTNSASSGNVGGLAGYFGGRHGDDRYSLIENCAVYADVTGGENVGGLVGQGWNGTQYWDITNAAYAGNVTGTNAGAIIGYQATDSNTSTFTNIYWCEDDGLGFYGKRDTENQVYTNTSAKTVEQFASGEVAYLLGEAWGQRIGTDDYPVLSGAQVYQVLNCRNKNVYRNTNENLDHIYENYVCTVCGTACPHESYEDGTCTRCGAVCGHSSYENGFCTVCDGYQSAVLNESGIYEISNAGQLYWFAQQVNTSVNQGIQVKLTADIDLEGREWTPIGDDDSYYTGIFDGQDHAITGFRLNITTGGSWGLFHTGSSATIQNFSIDGEAVIDTADLINYGVVGYADQTTVTNVHSSVDLTAKQGTGSFIGGIVGNTSSGNTLTVDRCTFSGTLDMGTSDVDCLGGIVGYVYAGYTASITNCGFYGTIISQHADTDQIGGILGYYRGSGLTMKNCLSVGTITIPEGYDTLVGSFIGVLRQHDTANTNVTNNYYLTGNPFGNSGNSDDITDGRGGQTVEGSATTATIDQMKSGEIAYKLGSAWGQTIGADSYPVLGGAKVFFDQENNRYYNDTAILGDLDGDGDVDAYDLTALARHVGGIELVTGQALLNADVDGDGDVDAYDLTKHARYVGGIITSWGQE